MQAQFNGLVAGYNAVAQNQLSVLDFQILNGVGDLLDMLNFLDSENRVDWRDLSPKQLERLVAERGHCSGLIKVCPKS